MEALQRAIMARSTFAGEISQKLLQQVGKIWTTLGEVVRCNSTFKPTTVSLFIALGDGNFKSSETKSTCGLFPPTMKVSEAAKFVLHQTISSLTTRKTEKQTNLLEADGLFASWWTNMIWMPRPAPCRRLLKYSIPMWKNSGPTNFPSPEVQISGETWAFYIKYLHQWCCAISLQTRESPSFCSHRYIIQDTVFNQPTSHAPQRRIDWNFPGFFFLPEQPRLTKPSLLHP